MDSPHGAAVKAEDFGLKGPRGWAFRGIGLDAAPGSLIAVEGPSGSGRTCLLLALTGRMKPTEGHAEVGLHRLPKKMAAVRRIAGLGPVPGVNDLDQSLTVAEQLREGALLQRHYGAPIRSLLRSRAERRATAAARIEAALEAAGLDLATLPKGERTTVRDLERLESIRLSVAIALLGSPQLLALDDLDIKLSDTERTEVWALLRSIAARGITVLAVCSEAPADAVVLRTGPAQDGGAPDTKPSSGAAGTAKAKAEAEPDAKAEAEPDVKKASGTKKTAGTKKDSGPKKDADTGAEDGAESGPGAGAGTTDNDDTKGADDALAEAGRA
ncbi:ATP-binding cassette domain-containing protein [Streptomyces sp. A0592]|uniref:ATP-binding cassette domain-containing protein n=1 Tax=Streptomyces sp. A0592 TaxID=2563099 RepID=UPI00109E7219|nr:ATP-binding cassette domain-containing protein [Streptomyces sp. A0592]THA83734.1 ATP-binding cassette domain-containing protein [Streptomyces sp. A0592]